MFGVEVNELRDLKQAARDFGEQVFLVRASKGLSPSEHDKDDDTERPNVSFEPTVFFALADFRRHVVWSAAANFQLVALESLNCESKVDEFDVVPVIHDDVFKLEVSVNNCFFGFSLRMEVL